MTDQKLSQLTAATSLASTDLHYATVGGLARSLTTKVLGQEMTGTVNLVRDFDADPTGATNSNAAFKAVRDFINSSADGWRANPAPNANTNKLSNIVVEIPPGDYLITESDAFLNGVTVRQLGLTYRGLNRRGCQILYQPAVSGPMISTADTLMFCHFENLLFDCDDASSDFMVADSSGGTQRLKFDNCWWTGDWQYGFRLTGTNNNDMYSWIDCGVDEGGKTSFTSFLFTEDSDQFINYRFNNFEYWCNSNFIRAPKGGHFKLNNCDFSGYTPTVDTYLFELLGNSHANGVQFFRADGCRFELKSLNALVLNCEWGGGAVVFDTCDFGSQASAIGSGFEPFLIANSSTPGPQVRFNNCDLMGKLRVQYGTNCFEHTNSILFEQCSHRQLQYIEDFVIHEALAAHTVFGSIPVVKFRECRTTIATPEDSSTVIWDADIGWHLRKNSNLTKKLIHIKPANGTSPISAGTSDGRVVLPENSVVTNIRANLPSGAVGEADIASFKVQTIEGTPTVLHSWSANPHSAGYDEDQDLFFKCGTALNTRTIEWVNDPADASQQSVEAVCIIEYLG